ncbi:hypothetical protein IQ06DRAFT_148990 [Phaeosphaeriaceae sp. SRC1lsM3a]|nr:hypothetical protein IQ06DRAFT_148990 [Stagonospora sp. SRC1lsM3a]
MRFSTSAIVAFATSFAFVAAQDLSQVPSCAIPCFATAIQGSGCSISDIKCQCTTGAEKIAASLLQCAPQKCSAGDIAKLEPAVSGLCSAAGVTLSNIPTALPSSGAAASTGAAASATASGSGSASRPASASATLAQSTGAASANGVAFGAVAMGLAAFAL